MQVLSICQKRTNVDEKTEALLTAFQHLVIVLNRFFSSVSCTECLKIYRKSVRSMYLGEQHDQLAMVGPIPPQQNFRYPQKLNKRKVIP